MAVGKVFLCRVPFALHLFCGSVFFFFFILRKYKLGMDFPDLPLSDGSAPNLLGHIQSSLPASISLPAAPTSVGRDGLSWRVPAAITAPAWDKNQYMRLLERGSCVTSSNYSSRCLWEGGMAPLCKLGTRHLGHTLFISFANIHRRGITP